jgi:hypothetical protein
MKAPSKDKWNKIEEEAHRVHLAETYGEKRRDVMLKLDEYNSQKMEEYGLTGAKWRLSGVNCPACAKAEKEPALIEMIEQVGVVLTSNPPKVKVRCKKCKLESYKII